jgi:sn-glycerol 3-phosphate transport system substrate-binding protein
VPAGQAAGAGAAADADAATDPPVGAATGGAEAEGSTANADADAADPPVDSLRDWHAEVTQSTPNAKHSQRGCRFASNTESGPAIALAMHRRAFLLSAAAVSGAASGCAEPPVPPGRVVVPFWFTYGGRNRATLETLIARFNRAQADVWVRGVFQGDYFEGLAKLRTALAAGAAPPLSHVVGEVVPYLAEAGVLEPLDDYPGARTLPLHPALGQSGSFRGGSERPLVIVPFNRSTPIAYADARSFESRAVPSTWEELVATARALTTAKRFGFGCPIDWWYWAALVGQAGGSVVEADGRVSLGDEAGVSALRLWQRLVAERLMKQPPGRDYNAWEQLSQDFLAGRVAMIWTSTAFVRYLEETADFPVRAFALPRGLRGAVPTGGTHFVLLRGAASEQKAAAWRFVRFLLEPEAAAFWSSETGYLPVTLPSAQRLEQSGFYARHPNYRVAVDQLAVAEPWPWSKGLFRIQRELVQPRLEQAVLEQLDPRRVLAEAKRLAAESAL